MTEEKDTPLEEIVDHPEDTLNEEALNEDTLKTDASNGTSDTSEVLKGSDEIAALKAESEKNLAGWQRTLAEFQNYKRRVEREQKELHTRITFETLSKIIPILDDFERALESVPKDLAENPWLNGVNLIQGKFKKLLEEYDIQVIDPVGEPFDPNQHQAISKDDSDEYDSDIVIQTLQKGYISGNHLLRPAIVRVAN